ncbi:MAG: cation diffusion facilitator family transporter [Chloroflexi bacterium]|nr:cation diffusion facilitator family transporter [Chloroflexota bacterium]
MTETITMQTQQREKGMAAMTSVIAAIFLTSMKLVIGLMTGSLGILAEAAHSALDLAAALITFFAVRVSDRPADEAHPYGHGKVENLSALAETFLLFITCIWIIYEGIQRIFFENVAVDPSVWAFVTMGVSIVIDYSRSRVLYRAAKKYQSQALEADALHFSTDIWSSSVVIVGLALVKLGELIGRGDLLARADAVAALVVAAIVIYVSIALGKRAVDALIDRAPHGLAQKIVDAVARVEGVYHVLQTRVRGSGNHIFVDLRVAVPRYLSFEESHTVTRAVQDAVRAVEAKADVVVHTVPVAEHEGVIERVQTVAARGHFAVHNITTHLTSRGMWIDLDLEVVPNATFEQAHARATELETQLRAEFADVQRAYAIGDINVHIEPRAEVLRMGKELNARQSARYLEQIQTLWREIPHARGCQDIQVQRVDGHVYLALHLLIDAHLTIAEVHAVAEEMENRLRREFPELGRVVVHTEPFLDKL